jgi:hypothetical protein
MVFAGPGARAITADAALRRGAEVTIQTTAATTTTIPAISASLPAPNEVPRTVNDRRCFWTVTHVSSDPLTASAPARAPKMASRRSRVEPVLLAEDRLAVVVASIGHPPRASGSDGELSTWCLKGA